MTFAELLQAQPWFTQPVALPHQPEGMLGACEAQLCYYLAHSAYQGQGTIVDAGSFLGKSAYCFAQGLQSNPIYQEERHRVQCFDNFQVNEGATIQFLREKLNRVAALGDSTRDLFDSQVQPVRHMLDVYAGDFHSVSWERQPVEILLVDIAKSVSLNGRVLELFFPELIPGHSLVVHQDYHHPWLPHIHVTMEYLADYFELVVPRVDDSAVFRLRAAIPNDTLQRAIDYRFSDDEQLALIDRAIARLPEESRFSVQLARIVLQFWTASDAALRNQLDLLRRRLEAGGLDHSVERYFDEVVQGLNQVTEERAHRKQEQEGWQGIQDGNFACALEIANKILRQRPTSYNVTMHGYALLGLERLAEAEQQFRAALGMRPVAGYAYIGLACTLVSQARYREAEAELLRGLRDPESGVPSKEFTEKLRSVWRNTNCGTEESAVVVSLRYEFPDDPEIWALHAWLCDRSGDDRGAEASLAAAARLGLTAQRLEEIRHEMELQTISPG